MVRFELNRPLSIANIEEPNWDIISRRSLVVEMKAKFFPSVEFGKFQVERREASGNSRKGDTLGKFLEYRPAALAFIRALYRYMDDNTMGGSRGGIDLYAMGEGRRGGSLGDRAALGYRNLLSICPTRSQSARMRRG